MSKDLFEDLDNAPDELKAVIIKHAFDDETYENCQLLLQECRAIGYTFDYGLDASPYNLRKMPKHNGYIGFARALNLVNEGFKFRQDMKQTWFELYKDDQKFKLNKTNAKLIKEHLCKT
jgi:hypothetical protein